MARKTEPSLGIVLEITWNVLFIGTVFKILDEYFGRMCVPKILVAMSDCLTV